MISNIRVGDRVIADTSDWGAIEGVVIAISFSRYVQIQSIANSKIYVVLVENCRRVSKKH